MRTLHADSRVFSLFNEAELRKLCGVSSPEWPLYTAKECLDNSAAAMEDQHIKNPQVGITISEGFVEISDSGSGIPDVVLDHVLNFNAFGGSNRHYKLPTRGAQGNALQTLCGIASVWDSTVEFGRRDEPTVRVTIKLDRVLQKVEATRTEISERPEGSFIRLFWPKLPVKRGGTDYKDVLSMAWMFARVNPHITFSIKIRHGAKHARHMFPALPDAKPCLVATTGAASWFTPEEFAERFAADVRARPDTKLSGWIREFLGSKATGADIAIGEMVDDDKAALIRLATTLRAKAMGSGSLVDDPKFAPVGDESLTKALVDLGADPTAVPQYSHRVGYFERVGGTRVPYLIEVCLVQMPKGATNAPAPVLAMNRTILYGSPSMDEIEYREKVRGEWRKTRGDLNTFANVYKIEHGSTPAAVIVHITCPSPGYKSYGKQAFDTDWLCKPLSECMEVVTLQCRKQQAGEARRKTEGVAKEDSIKDTLFRVLPIAYDSWTEGGKFPILIRNLFYGVRGMWEQYHSEEIQYATFCAYVDLWEIEMGRPMVLKDPRGTLLEPHSGKSVRLGTSEMIDYQPKKWEGHTIIFIEKENFVHVLKKYGIPKRWDAIVIGSKGFAVESCRDALQKYKQLLGGMVKIICLHDADPAGYMIGYDLANNLPRFGENVRVDVIDVGLTIAEGESMGLMTEPFELKKTNWAMINNMRHRMIKDQNGRRPLIEPEAWNAFMPEMYRGKEFPDWASNPKGRRIELNAMKPAIFIEWLEGHLERNGCRKVRPPNDIIDETLLHARENKVKNEVGHYLMRMLGNDVVLAIMAEIGVPSYDLDRVLANRPEQHWSYLCEQAAQRGLDLEPIIDRVIKTRLPSMIKAP